MRNAGASTQYVKGVIYAGGTLATAALLGTTDEYTMAGSQAPGWIDLVFASPVAVTATMYRIGLMSGGSTDCKYYYAVAGTPIIEYIGNTYTSGPPNPFGAGTQTTERESINVTYTTGGDRTPLIQFGIC
jgi:hypothetical protein